MAGRLRTQLKRLFELSCEVHELSERVLEAAPAGVFSIENTLKRLGGDELDEKAELWNVARDGISEADDALDRLHGLLHERVSKLPTYRPPAAPTGKSAAVPPVESTGS